MVPRDGRSETSLDLAHARLGAEIIERLDSADHAGKGRRDGRLRHIRVMGLSVDYILVQLSLERRLYLSGGATEGDPIPPSRDVYQLQAMCLQPA